MKHVLCEIGDRKMKYGVPRHPDTFEALPIRHLYVRSDRSENRQVLEGRLGIRPIDASTG